MRSQYAPPLAGGSVSIVGTPFTTLPWWLPGVVRVAELALGEVIEAFLLGSEHVELMLALFGIDGVGVDLRGLTRLGRGTPQQSTEKAHLQVLQRDHLSAGLDGRR